MNQCQVWYSRITTLVNLKSIVLIWEMSSESLTYRKKSVEFKSMRLSSTPVIITYNILS